MQLHNEEPVYMHGFWVWGELSSLQRKLVNFVLYCGTTLFQLKTTQLNSVLRVVLVSTKYEIIKNCRNGMLF